MEGVVTKNSTTPMATDQHEIDHFFERLLPDGYIRQGEAQCAAYNEVWRGCAGNALRVLKPQSVKQLQAIVKYCNEQGLPLVVRSGGTSLVGSSVANETQYLLSMEHICHHFNIDKELATLEVSAGYVLDVVNDRLAAQGLWLPIDISASGSAMIGGLIAANAAGTRAGFYGNTKALLKNISVMHADGCVGEYSVENNSKEAASQTLIQDNSALDRTNPFVGSQGTLGIIYQATFQLASRPLETETLLLAVHDTQETINAVKSYIKEHFSAQFTACEGMSDDALALVLKHYPDIRHPLADEVGKLAKNNVYFLMVELSAFTPEQQQRLQDDMIGVFEALLEAELVLTGRLDQPNVTLSRPSELWHIRHHITMALAKEGTVVACDVALPGQKLAMVRAKLHDAVANYDNRLWRASFGHEMMGAMHYNIVAPQKHQVNEQELRTLIYDIVISHGGSFSAEHNIGPYNQNFYDGYTEDTQKEQATALKNAKDPKHIFNPNVSFGW